MPGGLGPGAPIFTTRSRRRRRPRRRCGRWRGSARRSSRSGPGRRSSRSTACAASTAAPRRGVVAAARRGGCRADGVAPIAAGPHAASPPSSAGRAGCRGRLPVAALAHRAWGSREREAGELVETLRAARDRHAGGASPRSPPTRSPTASARSGCGRCGSPAARRSRCGRARRHEELAEEIELPEGTAGPPARPRPRAARRPPAGRAAAQGADAARRSASAPCSPAAAAGASSRAWAGRPPRRGSCAASWRRGSRRCRRRRRRCGCGRSASARRPATSSSSRSAASEPRRRRLGAAVREVRAAQGAEALLKVLPVDAASRVPERWAMLTPFPELVMRRALRASLRAPRGSRSRRPRRRPASGRRGRGRGGPRGVAGRGPLVDAAAAAPPLLRAGARPTAATLIVFRSARGGRWYRQRA